MNSMLSHLCIKPGCGNKYEDEEVDAYYCPSCNEVRKQIADEIDAKRVIQPDPDHATAMDEYDRVRGSKPFPTAKEMGIF